ncbi:hypothetical protein GTA09_30880 [Rhodococcus hoagii]|nr:hypothetical protein [Prescottella equi]
MTAEFTGAAGFTNSSASAQSVTVTDPDVTTSLSVTAPESATTGSSVDLSATVNPSNAVGSVQFTDNGAPIGSPVAVVNGVATLSHTFTSRVRTVSVLISLPVPVSRILLGYGAERDGG